MQHLQTIIEQCQNFDSSSQHELYRLFAPKLYAVAVRYSLTIEEAEDVLQEAFVIIFQKVKQYHGKGSFEGWMKRIVVNTALHKHRTRKSIYGVDNIEDYEKDGTQWGAIEHLSAEELMSMIQALPLQYRTVFNLYAIEGYAHNEIAEMLNISVGTSKSNLSRARSILKQRVTQLELV